MEAATSTHPGLLTRDGAVPVTPSAPSHDGGAQEAIDGVARCMCCERYPLLGERVARHEGRKGSGWVCESCEVGGRANRLGAVLRIERVRSLGGAMNVRRV